MLIRNNKLLKEMRRPGFCALCNLYCKVREGHHIYTAGLGGGGRLDIRINVLPLGGSWVLDDGRRRFACHCHRLLHDANIEDVCLLKVAEMEKVPVDVVAEVLDWMRRLIRPTERELLVALEDLSPAAALIARRELAEARVL